MEPRTYHVRRLRDELEWVKAHREKHGTRPPPHEVNVAIYGEPSPSFRLPASAWVASTAKRAGAGFLGLLGRFLWGVLVHTLGVLLAIVILVWIVQHYG